MEGVNPTAESGFPVMEMGLQGFAPAASSNRQEGSNEADFMYILELIGRIIVNLLKQAWLLPQTVVLARQQKRRQFTRHQLEMERLDRIRNPAKYAGR